MRKGPLRRWVGRQVLYVEWFYSAGKSSLPYGTVPTSCHSSRAWRPSFSLEIQMIPGKLHTLIVYQWPPPLLENTFVKRWINSWLIAKIGCRIVLWVKVKKKGCGRWKTWDIGTLKWGPCQRREKWPQATFHLKTQYFFCTVLSTLRYLDDFLFYPFFIPL